MPRVCTVCSHESRHVIEREIIEGGVLRKVAERHGITKSALERHQNAHLAAHVAQAHDARERYTAERLTERLETLADETAAILEASKKSMKTDPDGRHASIALKAIGRMERQLELTGRIVGQLREQTSNVNIVVSPEWADMRQKLMQIARKHPHLKADFVKILSEGGDDFNL